MKQNKMREIKFRAWDTRSDKMRGWMWIINMRPTIGVFFNDDDLIKMQYTGLKDKNGKEIYEGDLVKYNGDYEGDRWDKEGIAEVKYVDNSFDLFLGDEFIGELWNFIHNRDAIIIGNIWENKDLLK